MVRILMMFQQHICESFKKSTNQQINKSITSKAQNHIQRCFQEKQEENQMVPPEKTCCCIRSTYYYYQIWAFSLNPKSLIQIQTRDLLTFEVKKTFS